MISFPSRLLCFISADWISPNEESGQILSFDIDAKVADGFVEFVRIETPATIVIHNFKLAPKTDNTATSAGS